MPRRGVTRHQEPDRSVGRGVQSKMMDHADDTRLMDPGKIVCKTCIENEYRWQ